MNAKNEYPVCTYKYFKGGKVSTAECYDNNARFGEAIAYNRKGDIIYRKSLRKIGGHSSVKFSYYDDGAVSKAEWHEAPDGGIQWYNSATTFLKDGTIDKVSENSYDDTKRVTLTQPPGRPAPTKPVVATPTSSIECAVIYSSEFWYVNKTRHIVVVTCERINAPDGQFTAQLKPGQRIKGGQMILAQQFDYPDKYYKFSVSPVSISTNKQFKISRSAISPEHVSKEVRRYFYRITM